MWGMSTTILFDERGDVTTDAAHAVAAEIVWTDDKGGEHRTYGTVGGVTPIEEPPAWITAENGRVVTIDTVERLIRAVGLHGRPDAQVREELAGLLVLPEWDTAPGALKTSVYAYLSDHK